MKNTILICLLAFSFSSFAQTIRRVNDNSGVTGVNVYTTIQAAHDAATAGDIIYVEPSVTNYGSLVCNRRLTIIGVGYFLDKISNMPYDKRNSKIMDIDFNSGSAGSLVMGIVMEGGYTYIRDINITVTKCRLTNYGIKLTNGNSSYGNNATITKNVGYQISQDSPQSGKNCVVTNNFFYYGLNFLEASVISNNTFSGACNATNCTITNNIFDGRGFGSSRDPIYGIGNSISNNLSSGNANIIGGTGNVHIADPTIVFVDAEPWATYFQSDDSKFQLSATSPAKGIGTGGTDAGVFGGISPYVLSGLPPYPIITNFTTSGVGNSTTPLQVSVSVRGNN